ncbi:ribonuclease P protein component [Xanthobacter sp. V2C-8]|uniref:ribonuclease P protein component n=1 Tax=Xanthobacter albus TaxID=3119929 RepID=UPI00372AAD21
MDQLRKRRDFLAAAKAERAGVSAFLLQGRDRGDGGTVRIGYTVTKKTGNAVVRNRIRRRLREVARQVVPQVGQAGYDYVLVAREQALSAPFGGLLSDLAKALRKLHDPARAGRPAGGRRGPKPSGGPKAGRAPGAHEGAEGGASSRSPSLSGPADAPPGGSPQAHIPGPQALASGRGGAPHGDSGNSSDPHISSDPQAPSADGGHSA